MANPDHLAKLHEGVEVWNQWRKLNSPDDPVDLSKADLSEANLIEANLFQAHLFQAHLVWALLIQADLRRTDFRGADLSRADLSEAILHGADLSEAILQETVFGNTNLSGTLALETCRHGGPSILDHRTLIQSWPLPLNFLRGCGLAENYITYLPSLLNQLIEFYSCFISYNHSDKPFALRLHNTLQGRGIRCWLDDKQMLPGDDIHEAIDHGIRLWDKVLLCCSKTSLTSGWVDEEIEKAFAKERALMRAHEKKVLALIPLDLDGYLFHGWASGKASQIHSRLVADFKGWESSNTKFEEQIERVVGALRLGEHARETPPVSRL